MTDIDQETDQTSRSGREVDSVTQTRVGHTKADPTDVYAGRGPNGRDVIGTSSSDPVEKKTIMIQVTRGGER